MILNPIRVADREAGLIQPEYIVKTWGYELIYHNDENYCLKLLHIREGQVLRPHLHLRKVESFLVVSGSAILTYSVNRVTHKQSLDKDEAFHVPPGLIHSVESANGPCDIVEASTQHFDSDSIRI